MCPNKYHVWIEEESQGFVYLKYSIYCFSLIKPNEIVFNTLLENTRSSMRSGAEIFL